MEALFITLTIIVSVLLILVVLVQKSKGGGLASNFSGGNQMMGVRRTNVFIERVTWTLAIIILFLSIFSSFLAPANGAQTSNEVQKYNVPTENTNGGNANGGQLPDAQ